jgi:glycine/D-amino acid oxidase-like deaminating enzyme
MSSSTDEDPFQPPSRVIIAGAGIVGISTAYYLARNHNIPVTVIDPTGTVAPAASGKAGGFLALDWNDGSPTQQLTRRSFALHQQLADELFADSIQYRRLTCAAIQVGRNTDRKPTGKKLQGIEWAQQGSSVRSLGNEETIAQVHPKLLCQRLWEEVTKGKNQEGENLGCGLKKGKVVSAVYDDQNKTLKGVQLEDGSVVDGDSLLLACGPWTASNIMGIKYHSVVVPTRSVLEQCVFFSGCGDPEVYVRPDSTAYCTGFPDPPRVVTEEPGQEEIQSSKVSTILQAVRDASSPERGDDGELLLTPSDDSSEIIEQACYLPTTDDGVPVMGALARSCYIAAGHSCWGILLGPATGESMASLIATGEGTKYVDLRPFTPARCRKIGTVVALG